MPIMNSLPFIEQDERVRKYLLPARVSQIRGKIDGVDRLLHRKPLQIGLDEPEVTVLNNGSIEEEHASVVLDFGIELHGGVRLLVSWINGETPVQMRLTFGESLAEALSQPGEKNATNDHAIRDMIALIPALSDQEWGQTGFRYVRLELLTPSVSISLKAAVAVMVYREMNYLGSFHCSDESLNQIYDTAAYTCHLNMQNLLWDGIKRDRLVWIGDMHPEMLTIRSVFGSQKIVGESLEFVRDQTPLPGWMNRIPAYSMWWIVIVHDWYWYTGDEAFLNRQRSYVCGLLQQLCDIVLDDGTDMLEEYFLDWATKDTPSAKSGVRGLLRLALQAGENLAESYGEKSLAAVCRRKCQIINKQPELTTYSRLAKQSAAFLALSGAMPLESADRLILEGGCQDFSTFLSYYLLSVVDQAGHTTEALQILREYYGAMLDKGATTFWEDFNMEWSAGNDGINAIPVSGHNSIHGDCGAHCYTGFRHSLCHGWSSGPVPFLTEHILGIHIAKPGCTCLMIQPHLGDLEWAYGTYPTPQGVVTVRHQRSENGIIKTSFQAPADVEIIIAN